ncbi:unnamed protein product, partial [marine sediment metagenome]
DFLSGMAGKSRRLVKANFVPTANRFLRIYRDAEQIVDFYTYTLHEQPPFIELDLSLAEGQQCKVGFYNPSTEGSAMDIMIAYEEAD